MRTQIDLDEKLLTQVVQMGQFNSKKAAIQSALTEFVKTLKRRELLALRGQIEWQGDLKCRRCWLILQSGLIISTGMHHNKLTVWRWQLQTKSLFLFRVWCSLKFCWA